MSDQRESWSRREFVSGLTLAGTAGFAGIRPARVGAEPPPETTRLRLYHSPSVCVAPQYIVGELLKAEGFSDIKYVKTTTAGISKVLDRKSTRLNSSHVAISYAVFCLKKKNNLPNAIPTSSNTTSYSSSIHSC